MKHYKKTSLKESPINIKPSIVSIRFYTNTDVFDANFSGETIKVLKQVAKILNTFNPPKQFNLRDSNGGVIGYVKMEG